MQHSSREAAPHAPPTLVQYEQPLRVDREDTSAPQQRQTTAGTTQKSSKTDGHIEEILNSILPPRMWSQEDGSTWIQYVSKEPSSRLDVLTLQEALEQRLMQRQARETGLCPVREDLYRQCFDELIRQVCLNSPERGLLLLRVRDEIRMTIDAYKTLYESSVTFGVKKQLQAEEGMQEMEQEVEQLTEEKQQLENEVMALQNSVDMAEKRYSEKRQIEEKKRKDEISYLKHQAQHLETFLRSLPSKQ
eukprot:gb/GECG01004735.1/.p1 GENE.gb/GECG01004735.1/~~gb/GECG01004735.1/.p1  ORF type:complete len:247 (+),score=47.61 gb/GECG01004735.1/:1-741(+)